uniref:Wall-associated receptor kinase galacturonan-binding domain-containing protein n=1 Tax=Oryza meridionalis TaxID=40149 RepID=A0A0E0DD26_9ORYZ
MASYSELTILRLTIVFAAAVLLAGGAEAQCRLSCGGIYRHPLAFWHIGSGDDCALLPAYDVEVLSISLQLGCYNITSRKIDSSTWLFNLSVVPFMLSDSNKFTIVGCQLLAYISDLMSNYMSGCASSCPGATVVSATNGTCSGIGYCQTTIPRGLEYYEVSFGEILNTSEIYNLTPCSYAVLMDYSNFTFSTSYLASPLKYNTTYGGRQAPMMLDWAIFWGAPDCVEAQKNLTSYACKSDHSVCINYSSGTELAYMCNCSKGYHGNPYIVIFKTVVKILMSVNIPIVTRATENATIKMEDLTVSVMRVPEEMPIFQEDANWTFYNRKYDWHLSRISGIGIGLAVGLGILLILCGQYLLRKHRSNIEKQLRKKYFQKNQGLLLEQLISSDETASDNTKIFSLDELKKATNNFDATPIIGS